MRIGVRSDIYKQSWPRKCLQERQTPYYCIFIEAHVPPPSCFYRAKCLHTQEDVRALIAMADLDQDGSISFSEFCRILQWEENPVDRNAVDGSNKQSASDD